MLEAMQRWRLRGSTKVRARPVRLMATLTNWSSEPGPVDEAQSGQNGNDAEFRQGRTLIECKTIVFADDLCSVVRDGIAVNEASVERFFHLELHGL